MLRSCCLLLLDSGFLLRFMVLNNILIYPSNMCGCMISKCGSQKNEFMSACVDFISNKT